MNVANESRRLLIKAIFSGVLAASLLPACSSQEPKNQLATETLTSLLRHHGVAAHLGRLHVEAEPELASMTKAQLAGDILSSINLNITKIDDTKVELISERLLAKIREDFAQEAVTTVDGWLLSVTEADVCALIYFQVTQTS